MIQDKDCTTVYFSSYFPEIYKRIHTEIKDILAKYGKEPQVIPYQSDTKVAKELSIWCRDYMPIQVGEYDKILFGYDPDYLKFKKYEGKLPDNFQATFDTGHDALDLRKNNAIHEGIVLDGGNAVRCGNKVVMTNKVFDENPEWTQKKLVNKLEELFKAEIVFLPWDKREIYGHTDGILRYAGNNNVIVNTYGFPEADSTDRWMNERIHKLLKPYFDEILPMDYSSVKIDEACDCRWAYVNWLQLDDLIILPSFGNAKENEIAKSLVEQYLPEYKGHIYMVEATELVKTGGGFNCSTWTVL